MKYCKITLSILLSGIASFITVFPSFAAEHEVPAGSASASGIISIADVPQGLYEIASAADPDFILDVKHCTIQDTENKTLQMYRSLDVNQQKFYLEDLPGVACRFSALHSGDALSASEDGLSVTMAAMEHPEGAGLVRSQSWQLQEVGENAFYIQSREGKYLTLDASKPFNGAPVILSEFTGSDSQKWVLNETWISPEATADTDLINPYAEDGACRNLRIAMKFGTNYEFLRSSDLAEHMIEAEDHRLILDPEFLSAYVEQLAQKYDTQGNPRTFRTSYGTDITLYKGDFGWKLDTAATKAQIEEYLQSTTLETVSPVWSHKGGAFGETNDIGDSYVEIDLENQKVWLYKDGQQLLETDCVSGTFGTENQTPGGVYSIFYMQSPDVLNGPGYSSYVEYWMAFNGNIGLHDANWRSEFGGDIYLSNGSHGCVNLPTEAASLIYQTVSIGYPVVCYQ
ncbi:MAG: L,D-transpeptidase family protein [Lachnospiraceae bacterium]|nr:L,D-transpeptidase family protein [Lachnospiraceae bacterium]